MKVDQIYIEIAIVDMILSLEFESDQNRQSNLDGLKSESSTIRFVGPNHMSFLSCPYLLIFDWTDSKIEWKITREGRVKKFKREREGGGGERVKISWKKGESDKNDFLPGLDSTPCFSVPIAGRVTIEVRGNEVAKTLSDLAVSFWLFSNAAVTTYKIS